MTDTNQTTTFAVGSSGESKKNTAKVNRDPAISALMQLIYALEKYESGGSVAVKWNLIGKAGVMIAPKNTRYVFDTPGDALKALAIYQQNDCQPVSEAALNDAGVNCIQAKSHPEQRRATRDLIRYYAANTRQI